MTLGETDWAATQSSAPERCLDCPQTLARRPAVLLVTDLQSRGVPRAVPALTVPFEGPSEVGPAATFRLAADRQSVVCETWALRGADDERAAAGGAPAI